MRGLVLTLAGLGLAVAGCHRAPAMVVGSGVARAETRPVAAFTALDVAGDMLVLVSRADAYSLSVTGDHNVVPLVVSEVVAGTLVVKMARPVEPKVPVRLRITAPAVGRVALGGAVRLEMTGVGGDAFALAATGASHGIVVGEARSLAVTAAGATALDLSPLRAQAATITGSGAASVTVSAAATLAIDLAGTARVRYYGSPAVTQRVTGTGTVKQIGLTPP